MKNHYETLGLTKDASEQDIKKSYRSLAKKHHPDSGGDKTKFQEIQEAYEILSNAEKRAAYDNPAPKFNNDFNNFNFDEDFIFEHIFKNSPFGNQYNFKTRQHRQPTNQDLQVQVTIDLLDAFTGKELIADIILPNGQPQTINVKIPPGIHNGSVIKLAGLGDDSIKTAPRGNILLTVYINSHSVFHRHGDDLLKEIDLNCIDAMLGGNIIVDTIDGNQLQVTIPSGVQHGTVMGLQGQGMPNLNDPKRRGRLKIKVNLTIPMLSDEQKENLKKLNIS
jgi:DnaJ-class molecular chaperone